MCVSAAAYDTDIVLWSEEQARALRAAGLSGANLPIDWENGAEEIESLGKSQARELASRIAIILVHLMKLEVSPAMAPRAGWRDTVQEQRDEIERLLADAPSLRPTVGAVIGREMGKARSRARLAMEGYGERPAPDLDTIVYAEDRVLGGWFPGDVTLAG